MYVNHCFRCVTCKLPLHNVVFNGNIKNHFSFLIMVILISSNISKLLSKHIATLRRVMGMKKLSVRVDRK